jgi:TrmH family RNA methyltransferase
LPRVRIVLVRPETAVNVGATARILRATGGDELTLVAPSEWRTVDCWRTAWGAQDVLETARVFPDLTSALAGAHHVVAFSARTEGMPSLDVREAASEVTALADDAVVALVFGPETSGLTLAELAQCGRRAQIPTHPAQPSLNLSHAVMVAAYEVFRAGRRNVTALRTPATHDQKEAMLALLRDGLAALGALPVRNQEGAFREWRALFQRMDLTSRELRLLEHLARKMRPGRPAGGPPNPEPEEAAPRSSALDHALTALVETPEESPFADVEITEDGFSIPERKWRELLFVGALRPEGDAFVRDTSRPFPVFRLPGLFPPGARFRVVPAGSRLIVRLEPAG